MTPDLLILRPPVSLPNDWIGYGLKQSTICYKPLISRFLIVHKVIILCESDSVGLHERESKVFRGTVPFSSDF